MNDVEWLEASSKSPTRCKTCLDPGAKRIKALLAAVRGNRVPVRKLYARACDVVPGFKDRVGYYAFRNHVTLHGDA